MQHKIPVIGEEEEVKIVVPIHIGEPMIKHELKEIKLSGEVCREV